MYQGKIKLVRSYFSTAAEAAVLVVYFLVWVLIILQIETKIIDIFSENALGQAKDIVPTE